ncbi:MAG: glycosyltransferase family 2 protein [bacterium]|nr:glycosyltransferase family 2 protein [bacterium]
MNPTVVSAPDNSITTPGVFPTEMPEQFDDDYTQRLSTTFDQVNQLTELLSLVDQYDVGELSYELPADFTLSVIVPAYNEEKTICQVLGRLFSLPIPLEIVVVDDCSTDGTADLLRKLEGLTELKVIYKTVNEGKGAALRTGFGEATGDVMIVQDADLEYDPRDIPKLIRPIIEGAADVVYGSRFLGDEIRDHSFVHRLGNRILTVCSNLTTGLNLTDMETCYKAFRKDVIHGVTIERNRFGFEPEVTAKIARNGYRVKELPVSYNARNYDEGKKIGVKDGIEALWCIARYGFAE